MCSDVTARGEGNAFSKLVLFAEFWARPTHSSSSSSSFSSSNSSSSSRDALWTFIEGGRKGRVIEGDNGGRPNSKRSLHRNEVREEIRPSSPSALVTWPTLIGRPFSTWCVHFAQPIRGMMQTPIRIHISFQFGPRARVTYVGHSLLLNVIATFSQFPQLDVFSK